MNAVTNDELFDEILGRINHHDVRDDIERGFMKLLWRRWKRSL